MKSLEGQPCLLLFHQIAGQASDHSRGSSNGINGSNTKGEPGAAGSGNCFVGQISVLAMFAFCSFQEDSSRTL